MVMTVIADHGADFGNPVPAGWRYCYAPLARLVQSNWADLPNWSGALWYLGPETYNAMVGSALWHTGSTAAKRTVLAAWQCDEDMEVQIDFAGGHSSGSSAGNGVVFYIAKGSGTLTQIATSGVIELASWSYSGTVVLTAGDSVALMLDSNNSYLYDASSVTTFTISRDVATGVTRRRQSAQTIIRGAF